MKKLLFLTIFSSILLSCSNNDNVNDQDPILGKWLLFSNNSVEVSDCEKKNSIEFRSNNTTISETYQLINGNCSNTLNSNNTWENKGNNKYAFNNIETNIEFSNDNMTMRLSSGNVVYNKQQ